MKLATKILVGGIILIVLSLGVFSLVDKTILRSGEISSPSDWVKEEQIKVYHDKIILDVPNAIWSSFTDTNSMDPLIDVNSNAIEIKPENPEQIKVGDVISYQSPYGVLIHRVVEKGEDESGIYYLTKGDNNTFTDPSKIRFEEIEGVVVAVIY